MKVFRKEKMLARLTAAGRADQIDDQSKQIMTALDGREVFPNRWRQTVYGEKDAYYCTDEQGNQYPVNINDCEDV